MLPAVASVQVAAKRLDSAEGRPSVVKQVVLQEPWIEPPMNDPERGDEMQPDAPEVQDDSGKCVPRWHSEDLLQGQREVLIEHGDEVYRLRCTRNGKLILHK